MIKLNDKNYNSYILKEKEPIVFVFSSKTCPHCRTVEAFLEKVKKDYSNIQFYIIEGEKSPKLLNKFKVKAFPMTFFINKEKEVDNYIIGEGNLEDFISNLNKLAIKEKKKKFLFF